MTHHLATAGPGAYRLPAPDPSFLRKVVTTCAAYVRIDLVEERMFPLATVLRLVGVLFPVLMYYFQSSFLHLDKNQFGFILIGTATAAGLIDALAGLTARLQFAQERGTLETYLVEPVPWALIPVAMNIYRSLAGAVLASVMLAVGAALGAPIDPSGIPIAFLALLLGIAACNAVGALAGSFLVLFKRGEPVIMFYSLGATVLGGTLFPIATLPAGIRWMSYLVPHSYVIACARHVLMPGGYREGLSAWACIGLLTVFCVVGFTAALYLFDRSLRLARRLGTLAI